MRPLPFVLCWASLKRVWLSSFPQLFIHIDKIQPKPSLLQAEEFEAVSLSTCSLKPVCKPLLIFVALHCTYSSVSVTFVHWGSRTGQSTTNVASPGLKRRITSLDLLAMLFLIQHSTLMTLISGRAHLLAHVQLAVCQSLRSFYCKAAFQTAGPQPLLVHGVILS